MRLGFWKGVFDRTSKDCAVLFTTIKMLLPWVWFSYGFRFVGIPYMLLEASLLRASFLRLLSISLTFKLSWFRLELPRLSRMGDPLRSLPNRELASIWVVGLALRLLLEMMAGPEEFSKSGFMRRTLPAPAVEPRAAVAPFKIFRFFIVW